VKLHILGVWQNAHEIYSATGSLYLNVFVFCFCIRGCYVNDVLKMIELPVFLMWQCYMLFVLQLT